MTGFWLIVIGVLLAPFLAYYVAKFGVMGYLRGKQTFREIFDERGNDDGDK